MLLSIRKPGANACRPNRNYDLREPKWTQAQAGLSAKLSLMTAQNVRGRIVAVGRPYMQCAKKY